MFSNRKSSLLTTRLQERRSATPPAAAWNGQQQQHGSPLYSEAAPTSTTSGIQLAKLGLLRPMESATSCADAGTDHAEGKCRAQEVRCLMRPCQCTTKKSWPACKSFGHARYLGWQGCANGCLLSVGPKVGEGEQRGLLPLPAYALAAAPVSKIAGMAVCCLVGKSAKPALDVALPIACFF